MQNVSNEQVHLTMYEVRDALVLIVAVPMLDLSGVKIDYSDTIVRIRGNRKLRERRRILKKFHAAIETGPFDITVELPEGVELDLDEFSRSEAAAAYADGCILIQFPKKKKSVRSQEEQEG